VAGAPSFRISAAASNADSLAGRGVRVRAIFKLRDLSGSRHCAVERLAVGFGR
jgi:hypothetical protein